MAILSQCRSGSSCIRQPCRDGRGGSGLRAMRLRLLRRYGSQPVRRCSPNSPSPGIRHSHRVARCITTNSSTNFDADSDTPSSQLGRLPACIVSIGILSAGALFPVWQPAAQALLLPMTTGMVVTAATGYAAVPLLRRLKAGQAVRSYGPLSHLSKAGTPTAGGAFLIPCGLATGVAFAGMAPEVVATALGTLGFAAIGAIDDACKIMGKSASGLSGYAKAGLQVLMAACVSMWASKHVSVLSPTLGCVVPLWAGYSLVLVPGVYWALSVFTIVAESNGVNLTDGLDGLAGSTCAIAFTALALVLAPVSNPLAIMAAAMGGASAGFLAHNRHVAACFMGDTGSLALGAMAGILGVLTSGFGPLLLVSGVYAAEAASVVLQVGVFRLTKRMYGEGRRVLRMAPLHHHLELCGWPELRVTNFLTAVAALLAAAAVFGPMQLPLRS